MSKLKMELNEVK